jgi:hypothetical protein
LLVQIQQTSQKKSLEKKILKDLHIQYKMLIFVITQNERLLTIPNKKVKKNA